MRTTTARCIVLVSTILAVLSPAGLLGQSAESSPGINRPVTREEIDRLRSEWESRCGSDESDEEGEAGRGKGKGNGKGKGRED